MASSAACSLPPRASASALALVACPPGSSPTPRPLFLQASARAQSVTAAAAAATAPLGGTRCDRRRCRPRGVLAAAAAAEPPVAASSSSSASVGVGAGNGEVAGGGAGTRLTPGDMASVAGKKAGRPTSASGRVSDSLASVSLVVVGPSSDLNAAVAAAVGKRLGWFAVATRRVLLGMHKAGSVGGDLPSKLREAASSPAGGGGGAENNNATAPDADDDDLVGAAEAEVLRGLSTQFRCAVATLGGPASAAALAARGGAGAQDALRRRLAGCLVLWVDEIDRRGPSSKPAAAVERASEAQRPYALLAEVRVALESGGGFGAAAAMTAEQKADKAAGQIVATLQKVLEQDEEMPARKRAYVEEVLIGRERLAEAAEKRAEGLERAQQAAAEAAAAKRREEGGEGGGDGGGDGGGHPLDR